MLPDTGIFEDVAVVLAVDDGNPDFAVHHRPFVDDDVAAQRDTVPRTALNGVAAVALVFDKQGEFAYEAVFVKQRLAEADARVEDEIVHGHRLFEHIPEHFLRVHQEQIRMKR